MNGLCRLCGRERSLVDSHILPAFVFRWKRESAGGSALRSTKQPNLRVQDGLKVPFLCEECEAVFSRDEREFANKIFYPYTKDRAAQLPYGPWLLRFCTSVSWRVLKYAMEREGFARWEDSPAEELCQTAEEIWRAFLLGERAHPGDFRQQILPFDLIESSSQGASANINRYLTRATQFDVCYSKDEIFTLAKLGPIGIFGTIRQRPSSWKGTRVQGNQGSIGGPRKYVLPAALWTYLNEKARQSAAALAEISPKQQDLINQSILKNADAYVQSDSFRAMQADVGMFGQDAFTEGERIAKRKETDEGV